MNAASCGDLLLVTSFIELVGIQPRASRIIDILPWLYPEDVPAELAGSFARQSC
jgi:hypothetical protein